MAKKECSHSGLEFENRNIKAAYNAGYKQGTDDTVKRFLLFYDNAGMTPNKAKRYEKLLNFVKAQASKNHMCLVCVGTICEVCDAKELLEEIGCAE